MIDFIRIFRHIDNHRVFLERTDIDFSEKIQYRTKKKENYFSYKDVDKINELKVSYNNWLEWNGSITKYWYEENYTNLPYSDLACAIHSLADTLYSHPNELNLKSFEFGINILLQSSLNALELTDLAFNYKNKFFRDFQSNGEGIGKVCISQEYLLKLYSKSVQYKLPNDLLRFEVKIQKMNYLKGIPIKTLEDLLDKKNLILLKQKLIEHFEDVLFFDDSVPLEFLKPHQKAVYQNWQSEIYRKKLLKIDKRKFDYQKNKVIDIIQNHGQNNIQSTLINQINNTWQNLLES